MNNPMYCFWSDSLVDADKYVPHIDEFLTPYDALFDFEDATIEDAIFNPESSRIDKMLSVVKNVKANMANRSLKNREKKSVRLTHKKNSNGDYTTS